MKKNILFAAFVLILSGITVNSFASTNIYYSVGASGEDLKTGTPKVTISGGIATFSEAQSDKIGVGDEISYNTNNLAYISKRISDSTYNVVTAIGSTAADIDTSTVEYIKRAFNSLSSALTGISGLKYLNTSDLVSGDYILNLPCYGDSVDSTVARVHTYVTSPKNHIHIYTPYKSDEVGTSQRHNGEYNETNGTYCISVNTTGAAIRVEDDNVFIDGIQIKNSYTDSLDHCFGIFLDSVSNIQISNCIIVGANGGATVMRKGIQLNRCTDTTKIWNNIIYNWGIGGTYKLGGIGTYADSGSASDSSVIYVYNNTICNTQRAVHHEAGLMYLKNNVAVNSPDGFYVGGNSVYHDSSANNATNGIWNQGINQIKLSSNNVEDYFAYATNFHIDTTKENASKLVGTGIDLSSDSVLSFNTDIDGQSRDTKWDIGADQVGKFDTPHIVKVDATKDISGLGLGVLTSGNQLSFLVELNKTDKFALAIYNVLGKTYWKTKGITKHSGTYKVIPRNLTLANGSYIVTLSTNNGFVSKKIQILR